MVTTAAEFLDEAIEAAMNARTPAELATALEEMRDWEQACRVERNMDRHLAAIGAA